MDIKAFAFRPDFLNGNGISGKSVYAERVYRDIPDWNRYSEKQKSDSLPGEDEGRVEMRSKVR